MKRTRLFGRSLSLDDVDRFGGEMRLEQPAGRKPLNAQVVKDPRLRGLDVGRPGKQDPYDVAAARYQVLNGDPYAESAREQEAIGRRLPLPYQAPSALAGMPSVTGVPIADQAMYADLNNEFAINAAPSVAGMRQTQFGGFGARTDTAGGPWFDARHRLGYGRAQSRGSGFDERWDTQPGEERTAGRLTRVTKFDQEVNPDRPYLHLRAGGTSAQAEGTYDGNAIMTVIAGNYKNGGTEIRRFWIGGGIVACFDLRLWENVSIELEELLDGTFVDFAWTDRGLEGSHRSLLLPDTYGVALGTTIPVPQGAHAISIEEPGGGGPTTLVWTGRAPGGGVWSFTETVNTAALSQLYYGKQIPVKAPTFRMSTTGDILWWLRPI